MNKLNYRDFTFCDAVKIARSWASAGIFMGQRMTNILEEKFEIGCTGTNEGAENKK